MIPAAKIDALMTHIGLTAADERIELRREGREWVAADGRRWRMADGGLTVPTWGTRDRLRDVQPMQMELPR